MKVLLIRPPARHGKGSVKPAASIPLGLLSIAAVLERSGHAVEIYDARINAAEPVRRAPDGGLHQGDPWSVVAAELARRKPDLAGITCMFTAQIDNVVRTAEMVKAAVPGIPTVVGGNHPTVRPEDFLSRTPAIDIVCRGEGEYTMLEIADALRAGKEPVDIPGTVVRGDGAIRINPPRPPIRDLDSLPFPAYHLIALEDHFLLNKRGFTDRPIRRSPGFERAVSVVTSRGCPYHCVFCSIHLHMGRRWRPHSVDYVLRHIDYLKSRYGIRHVHFEDDNISFDRERFGAILQGLIDAGPGLSWDTPNGVRVDTLTREIVRDCRRSGCAYLIFGVESGNQAVLDRLVEKRLDLTAVTKAAALCREASLSTMAFYVIGFPGETRAEMRDTVNFALRLQRTHEVTPHLYVATPLPGTKLETLCMEKGLLDKPLSPDELARMTQGAFVLPGDTFTAGDVRAMRRRFIAGYLVNLAADLFRTVLRRPGSLRGLVREFLAFRKYATTKEALLCAWRFRNAPGNGTADPLPGGGS